MQCLILAGGKGQRLGALTRDTPKPLLPIHGTPFLHFQLEDLARQGVKDVVLSIGYRGDQIRSFVGDGGRWGLQVRYVDEGTELRGTGGAIRFALDSGWMKPTFFVMYGDSFLTVDFPAIWRAFEGRTEPLLMTVLRNEGQWDQSNACFDGERVTLYQKSFAAPGDRPASMRYIDYGLLVVRAPAVREAFREDDRGDLSEWIHRLSVASRVVGYEVHERFYEIGSLQGMSDFERKVTCKA